MRHRIDVLEAAIKSTVLLLHILLLLSSISSVNLQRNKRIAVTHSEVNSKVQRKIYPQEVALLNTCSVLYYSLQQNVADLPGSGSCDYIKLI